MFRIPPPREQTLGVIPNPGGFPLKVDLLSYMGCVVGIVCRRPSFEPSTFMLEDERNLGRRSHGTRARYPGGMAQSRATYNLLKSKWHPTDIRVDTKSSLSKHRAYIGWRLPTSCHMRGRRLHGLERSRTEMRTTHNKNNTERKHQSKNKYLLARPTRAVE